MVQAAEQREIKTAKGDVYIGEHQDGRPHGQGTLTLVSGDVYVGEFSEGQRHGQGKMTMS